jgi:hypothetical protein
MIRHKLPDEALRDFFAGLAMQVYLADFLAEGLDLGTVPINAYHMADKMLKFRKGKDEAAARDQASRD